MTDNWKQDQARLLDDIERFSRTDVRLPPEAAQAVRDADRARAFPELNGKIPPPRVVPAPTRPAAVAGADVTQSMVAGGNLLAQLKAQAEAKLAAAEKQGDIQAAQAALIDRCLRDAYAYLRELCEQLNVLKPPYPGVFTLGEIISFDNLGWEEGRTDYRRQVGATDDQPFERVTLRYVLSAPEPIVFSKENPIMDTVRKTMLDYGLTFNLEEKRNARGYSESGVFTVQRAVKVGLLFVGDYTAGHIKLRTLNAQRLGSAEYLIPPDALTHDVLEEIALLVLGQSTNFVRRFQRIA